MTGSGHRVKSVRVGSGRVGSRVKGSDPVPSLPHTLEVLFWFWTGRMTNNFQNATKRSEVDRVMFCRDTNIRESINSRQWRKRKYQVRARAPIFVNPALVQNKMVVSWSITERASVTECKDTNTKAESQPFRSQKWTRTQMWTRRTTRCRIRKTHGTRLIYLPP